MVDSNYSSTEAAAWTRISRGFKGHPMKYFCLDYIFVFSVDQFAQFIGVASQPPW